MTLPPTNSPNGKSHPLQPIRTNINVPNLPINMNVFCGDNNKNIIDWLQNFESFACAFNWNEEKMSKIIPNYLQGTVQNWHKFIYGPFTPKKKKETTTRKSKNYQELKTSMIKDLCSAD